MAVYVVCLAIYPCSDSNIRLDEKGQEIVAIAMNDFQQATSEQDICSPFCICTCCASKVQASPLQDILNANPFNRTGTSTPYLEKPSLKDHQSIFQPPRA